jgi:hypothetical protein
MRTRLLGTAAVILPVVLAGCAGLGAGARAGPEDVLFIRTSEGITLVRALPKGVAINFPDAVPSTDWSAVVRALPGAGETRVETLDSPSGALLWSRDVPGNLEVKVAARGGSLVALGSPRAGTGYPGGRSTTRLVIAGADGSTQTIELEGNYEPEAFSTDGQSLFVIEYLPPKDPTRYRVRRLDLRSEQVLGVYTVDAELQEAMQGTARIQAPSSDGTRLYTLYTLQGPDGTNRAFVHVLALDELWAHCVDLPSAFVNASEESVAITVAPDGRHLYVAEASTGTVAEVDTEALAVTRTAHAEFDSPGGAAHAAAGPDGTLYLGKGTRLVSLDASTLSPGRAWEMDGRITGIQVAGDGTRLYVGLKDHIVILDAESGEGAGVIDPASVGTIDQLGQETASLDEDRTGIECAC